jgi:transcriptional regulator with AAA-type ATPase domain
VSGHYVHGKSKKTDQQITNTLRNAKIERAKLTTQLQGVTTELEALRRARDIITRANRDARIIREQAYDFGLAQLDRDYPTRQHRNRERQIAKTKLVKRYAQERLLAAANESAAWDAKQGKEAA